MIEEAIWKHGSQKKKSIRGEFSRCGAAGSLYLDNRETSVREYIRHPGGAAIVPAVEGSVILILQFRIAIERELIELPAGLLEPGEDPILCAARELEEEIGYRAK